MNTTRHRYLIGNLQHAPNVTMTIARRQPAEPAYSTFTMNTRDAPSGSHGTSPNAS